MGIGMQLVMMITMMMVVRMRKIDVCGVLIFLCAACLIYVCLFYCGDGE